MKRKLQKIKETKSNTKYTLFHIKSQYNNLTDNEHHLEQYQTQNYVLDVSSKQKDIEGSETFFQRNENPRIQIKNNESNNESLRQKENQLFYHKRMIPFQSFTLVIFLILFALISRVQSTFAPLDYTANAMSDYELEINDFKIADAGSVVIITFPYQYSAYQMYRNQPYSGIADYCFSDCSGVTLQYYAYTIILNNMFPSAAEIFFKYTIRNIKNPSYAVKTNDIVIQVKSSDLLTTFYSQTTQIQFTPPQFQTLLLTIDNPYLWEVSQLNIDISITPQTNYLRIVFPTKWENQTLVDSTILSNVIITSSTHTISFTKTLQTFNIQIPPISINQILKLTFKSIYTPSSVINIGSIIFSAFDYQNNIILQSSTSISSSQLTTDFPRQSQAVITTYDQVNNKVTIKNKFKYPRNALRNDKFTILYPPQLTISTLLTNYQVYISGSLIPNSVTIFGNNSIEVSPFTSSYFQPDLQVAMTIPWPRTIISTSNFKISTFRLIGSLYAQLQESLCCSLWIKQKPTLIATLQISNNERLKTNVQYKFNLTHSFSTLANSDSIIIQFPAVYQLTSSNQTAVCSSVIFSLLSNSSNLNPSFGCTLSSNILKFSNIFLSVQSPALLNLEISLINPSQSPNQNFQIWSQDSLGLKIQSNGGLSLRIGPASLSNVLVTPSSFVTNQKCSYSLSVTGIGTVLKNSIIKVKVPSEIKLLRQSVICKINTIQQYCSLEKINQIVSILVSADLGSITFLIEIDNLINPETLSQSSKFKVQIFDPSGSLVQSSSSLSSGVTVTMIQPSVFIYNKMWTDSINLDQKGRLKFIIVTKNNLQIGSNYQLNVILSSRSLFRLNDVLSVLTFDGNVLGYSLVNSTSESQISIIFSPVVLKNIYEFELSQIFIFKDSLTSTITLSKQVNLVYYQSVKTNSVISLENRLNAVLISDYQISQDNYYLNQSLGSLVFKINTISNNITFSSILINIPKNYQSISATYQYLSNLNSTTVSFTIPDLLNPIQVTQQPFTFIIYDSSNQIVGISQPSSQYFNTKCTFPCRTCKSISQPSLCIDCYQIDINKLIYFRETVAPYGVCIDHCVEGEYSNITLKKCLKCSTNCSSCIISINGGSGDGQKCTKCGIGKYLLNDRCYSVCPDGYYSNNLVCSQCLDNCMKCGSLYTCNQCNVGFALYQGKCLLSCPLRTILVVVNSSMSICSNCSSNCLICTAVNTCSMCQSNYYLYNSVCYSNCPIVSSIQLYPNMNNTCTNCQCLTCTQFSYKCLTCSNGLIHSPSQFKCKTHCDDGYYNNSGTCLSCPTSCLKCTNPNLCLICKQPYSLYTINSSYSQCLSQCPNTTLMTILSPSQLLQCLPCNNGCSSCLLSPSFCTQCSIGYIFYNNMCLTSCTSGYHNISGYCKVCVDQCQQCSSNDPRNCSQCSQGYFLDDNFCFAVCPQGTYAENSLRKCLTCQSLCETCMNATHCTSCKAGYYLFPNNLCYTSCPTTPVYYYTYNSQCMLCQPQCTSCLSSPVQCSSCSSPYFYQNQDTKQCSTTCIDGYFIKDNMCVKCQSPCLLCDTTYSSCLSCHSNSTLKYVYQGQCLQSCPSGYYADTYTNSSNSSLTIQNKCMSCPFSCLTCSKNQCFECESFAFMYKQTCVLDCSTTLDMPFQKEKYCTNCIQVPFCSICDKTQTQTFVCWQCTYPYVLFEGQCLNQCPQNYEIYSDSNRTCIQNVQTQFKRQKSSQENKPSIPFPFLIFFIFTCLILYPLSRQFYEYTYHIGYQIFVVNLLEYILVYNWLINLSSKYQGQYFDNQQKSIPQLIILVGLIINLMLLGWIWFGYAIKQIYLKDVRYQQWKTQNPKTFIIFIILFILFGPKTHKLFYSKLFGLKNFSYRVISVEKFHLQDKINFISIIVDLLLLFAFFIVAFNVYIQYSALYMSSIQIFIIKLIQWTLIFYDSKKPDRGFFYGDQKVALEEIQKEEEQKLTQLKRIDTDHLIKMIRRKSAAHLSYDQHPFGQIQKAQFLSVYNPQDYEDVPQVPLFKIQQNIKKGKFRKGRKITIQQKLQRFADSIKPKPKIVDKQEYIHGLIYWKPPKKIKITKQQKIEPVSEQSMIKMLEDKQMEYKEDLDQIQNIVFQEKQTIHHNFKTGQFFYKSNDQLNVDSYNILDSSNASIQQFQDFSSQIFKPSNQDIEYNDLMNLNYARKKHLPQKDKKPQFDDNQLRILYHQPKKRRVSRINK